MTELIVYAVLFLLLMAHSLLAGNMYRAVHKDESLTVNEKNEWKLRALIFPAYYWRKYKKNAS
ncbi:hypothetical protein P872_01935 [Rhodonellum psychrophilum GCM71 = DSM 17998]|uniref:Uncharacterized protein n=2 Tax=Rhodonellum TaxID=336827 RepID=U5C1V9_9BACT|nr:MULTISPECIES: hypothetical protein [Rhodonellum]ERM83799.1 hypothetical protein P872_01935 [Rhodonellum psychrophilum GCM71 = DSM 17998]SDY65536.1 hypothetical protein SAMN05444412_102123 [Rhodonellum ikkaensis]